MTTVQPPPPPQLLDLIDDVLCLTRHGRIVWINDGGARHLGHRAGDLIGRPFALLLHPDHRPGLENDLTVLLGDADGKPMIAVRPDGGTLAMLVLGHDLGNGEAAILLRDVGGRVPAVDALVRAVTRLEERSRQMVHLARMNDLAAKVFDTASEGILVLDADMRVSMANPAFADLTGWSTAEVLGRKAPQLVAEGQDHDGARLMFEAARSSGRWQGEHWTRRKNGERYAERIGISTILDEKRQVRQYVVMLSDITQRKQDEERIRRQANFDALTGLPNRALFLDRLNQAVHQAERGGQQVGLMFIDLDGFKLVNDTLGHDMGDLLLQDTATRLTACIRAGDTVARLGGDEFTVLMPDLGSYQNAPVVARRILDALQRPFDLAGREAFVSGSIGITIFPDDAIDAATMLKNADAAMYRAKEQGKANFQFFTADMNAAVLERLTIKDGLRQALERQELTLVFQPKMDLATGAVTGVEALLRWHASDLGEVSPAKFIPVMEEAGLMGRVGEWAINAACRQYQTWQDQAEVAPPRIAINLSVRQLRAPGFVDLVQRALSQAGLSASTLEFEITEGMVAKDGGTAITVLEQLAGLGIGLAMDDFGTGSSSLSVIRRFPVDSVKIDRSFVADITHDGSALEIIRAIISMGHAVGRRIIAEGVETPEQVALLRQLGCDEIQGFVLAPPLPGDQVPAVLAHPPRL